MPLNPTASGRLFALIALLALAGCVEDGGTPDEPTDVEVDVGIVDAETDGTMPDEGTDPDAMIEADTGPDPDDGVQPDDGVTPDDGVIPDRGVEPDMGAVSIETCEDACDRYQECDRLGDEFGDYDACLRDCGRISRNGRPDEWFDCVELETCNLLRLCPVPEIEPLGCDEVCGLVDSCGVDLEIPDCQATCEANAETFAPCGDALFGDVCDNARFAECVVREVFPDCRDICTRGVACNLVREEDCIADCLDDRLSGDPLGALRSRQLAQCTRLAVPDPLELGDNACVQADACFFPEDGPPPADPAAFCRRYGECGFGEFLTCDEMLQELGGNVACGLAAMQPECPFDEFFLFDACFDGGGPDPRAAPCGRLCEAREVCGLLAEGENRIDCSQDCVGGADANPDEQERADAILPCGNVDRCPALVECIDSSGPAVECAALCGTLDGCGLADENCLADCDARWARDRHAAWRTCVADAADCEAVAECPLDPPPPCEEYCARVGPDECGFEGNPERCIASCDDSHFAEPAPTLARVACVLTAEVCSDFDDREGVPHDVRNCLFGNPQYGLDCLGFCRATSECAGDIDGLAPCLAACGAGLAGDDGLLFLASRDCLAAQPADAACEAVTACVPEDTDADCAALCDRAGGCGIDLEECPARCVDDPLARLRALRAEACIGPEDACDDVEACILPPPFAPDPADVAPGPVDQATFCAAQAECPQADLVLGPCDFIYGDLDAFGDVRCAYDILVACPADLERVFDCFGGAEPEPPNPLIEPCAVLCEARRFCEPVPPAQRDCEQACQAQLSPVDPDSVLRLTPQMQCGSVWSCPELQPCLDASSPEAICAAQCDARVGCGLEADAQDCQAACDADFGRAREIARRACLADVDPADCEAVAACEPPRPLPCDLACAALEACGPPEARCVEQCEDAGFADPAAEAQRIACLVAAGDDCDAVAQCQVDPGAGGGACFAYCRATTECDPDAAEELPVCLTRCLTGFGDGDALAFASAEACLDAAGAAAECADLTACLPEEPAVDCAQFCGALGDCQIPAVRCLEVCEAAPDEAQAICVADALRTGQRCTGVAACVDFVPPPADDVCRALCQYQTDCDGDIDPYLCRLGCTPTPPAAAFQLACAEFSACGEELAACLALDDTPVQACVDLCGPAVDACGVYPDAAACIAECTGREAATITPPDQYLERAAACFDDAVVEGECDVAEASTCLQPAFCEQADDLIFFQGDAGQVETDTTARPDNYASPCAGGGAAEQVIVINVAARSNITAEIIEGDYDTAMNIRAPCDGEVLQCDDDGGEGLLSRISIDVEAGTYYLFVEGFSDNTGTATVDIQVRGL